MCGVLVADGHVQGPIATPVTEGEVYRVRHNHFQVGAQPAQLFYGSIHPVDLAVLPGQIGKALSGGPRA